MNPDEVKRYIRLFHERDLPGAMERELQPPLNPGKATAIIGPRRSGKTYLLYSMVGENRERYVYLNFENPLLFGTSGRDFPGIVDAYFDLYPENVGADVFFLLDEVQNVPGWETGVRYLLDEGFRVAVTGSSSKLLSREVATQLRGRGVSYTLLPLSFREFLRFKGVEFEKHELYGRKVHLIKKLLEEYLRYGAFPEVALLDDRVRILEEYLSVMITKDIVERHRIRNVALVEVIVKLLLSNYAKYTSYSSIHRFLKSEFGTSKTTVLEYLRALEDSFFVFFLPKFAPSRKESLRAPRKVYLIDTGLALFSRKDPARDVENAVFLELLRRKHYSNPLLSIHYYGGSGEMEVDFVVSESGRPVELIQVTMSLEGTMDREISALIHAGRVLGCKNLTVVTLEDEDAVEVNDLRINVVPLWKFLLGI
ncbi:ATP-binding protein [Thermococcus sp. JdF3]|uniref:ATP-binding protein n=1 Tax=Thermococcus sp. JdF3 TaxID=1638258 RepID=UPI001438B35C|nr:ATP-binding protein [Thermococcus sp. JdF3]NJE01512.1 ATP-binding protein [Thermococcus sp. JdF3]